MKIKRLHVLPTIGLGLALLMILPLSSGQIAQARVSRDIAFSPNILEETRLTASDAQDDDTFGNWVTVSGDTMVVTAESEDGAGSNRGAAYLHFRNLGGIDQWGEVVKLTASDAQDGDYFGTSAAINESQNTIVIGANWEDGVVGDNRGAAYVYDYNLGQVKKLIASDAANRDYFGTSVSISGETIVVGANFEDGSGTDRGAAYVFMRNQGGSNNWGEVKKLTASDAADQDLFGRSLEINGDTIIVGADFEDGTGSDRGAAYIFMRNLGGTNNWGQVKKITASDTADLDLFGTSVAISADTAVVGAIGVDGPGTNQGAVYVFYRNQGGINNWGQLTKLTGSKATDVDDYGSSVAISGDKIVVGADSENGDGNQSGAAYVYQRNFGGLNHWGELVRLSASDAASQDHFGWSVDISAGTVISGASREDGLGSDRGAAYVYDLTFGTVYLPLVNKNN